MSNTKKSLTIGFATSHRFIKRRPAAEPRPTKGFFSGLTDAQKEAALAFDGEELIGSDKFRREVLVSDNS